jgi:hypothetical protein
MVYSSNGKCTKEDEEYLRTLALRMSSEENRIHPSNESKPIIKAKASYDKSSTIASQNNCESAECKEEPCNTCDLRSSTCHRYGHVGVGESISVQTVGKAST